MNGKAFLKYLILTNKITKSQVKSCIDESTTGKQNIAQTLIQQGYFTPNTLKQCIIDFNLKQKNSFIPVLQNNALGKK